jgi:CheY-like chemotaxis protein
MAKRILLADDSITIQKVVELTFSDGDYEVTAVNNGAKAIAKLSEMRPDIILSDIIMPEKNGYEVCEYVKSHPEYRTIPVILLTGTFEPFDPDRAEKAGCDAVVTKPFESQSLIHKVEELIEQSASSAPAAAAPAPEPVSAFGGANPFDPAPAEEPAAPGAWGEPPAFNDMSAGFASEPIPEPAGDSPFDSTGGASTRDAYQHDNDIFGAAPAASASAASDLPFETEPEPEPAAFSGETRAFPRMSFEEMQAMANAAPAAPEPSPWDAPAAREPSMWDAPAAPEPSAWSAPAAPEPEPEPEPPAFGGETRAFPRMSFDELQRMANEPAAPEASPWDTPAAEAQSPWDTPAAEPEAPAFGGETRAFPALSYDELKQMAAPSAAPAEAPAAAEESPWGETPAEPSTPEPLWSSGNSSFAESSSTDGYSSASSSPFAESSESTDEASPFGMPSSSETPSETSTGYEPEAEPAGWSPAAAAAPELAEAPAYETEVAVATTVSGGELSDAQIERIARRVVELMSDHVVRNIAWEVIPDLAEVVVKERIRQLENEG